MRQYHQRGFCRASCAASARTRLEPAAVPARSDRSISCRQGAGANYQGARYHDPVHPQAPGQQPCQGGKHSTVSPVRPRARDLPAQDRDRDVAEHAGDPAADTRRAGTLSQTAERRAQKAVAVTFFLLAPYTAIDAIHSLVTAEHAKTSWLGIGLSIASLIVMPLPGTAKKRIGARLDSRATIGEGVQNMLCAYLTAAVLAGLLANTWFGLWWADPVIALGIAALAVHEGREAWEGEEDDDD